MNLIIFGPQGSGKGTQAELIARRHSLPYMSTGDIFRYNLKNETELGKQVKEYMDRGELVLDEMTNEIVKDRILQPDCAVGFVLDGFPRNKNQAEFLESIAEIDQVIVIELSDQEAIKRLSGRLACKCGLSYHKEFNPPKNNNTCDKCGDSLFVRDDDNSDAIKQRLSIYHQETESIFDIYQQRGILKKVDGSKSIEEVYSQINEIINNIK